MTALVIAHGHPRFNKGGAEIAAYRLYQALRETEGWEQSCFLAACPDNAILKPGCEVFGISDSEWMIRRSSDPFLHDTNINITTTAHGFLYSILKDLNPNVIHVHHYVHIGLDLLHALMRWFPKAKILLTLHEYWGLCPYEGRLLKRSGRFCNGPEPDDCATCVGEEMRLPLAVRRLRVEHFFAMIDQFISPSYFLKQRYVDWGIPDDRITVIENLPLRDHDVNSLSLPSIDMEMKEKEALVFAYFGQINRWKGIDIILEAFCLAVQQCPNLCLELHGLSRDIFFGEQDFYDQDFLLRCRRLFNRLPSSSIRLMGAYEPGELKSRLQVVDVVVMASRWYENSPMVIQEAFSNGVPVIAPNYGGMAEKIKHRTTGLLFNPLCEDDLSNSFLLMAQHPDLLLDMKRNSKENSLAYDEVLQSHIALYGE
ncbi:MAG TPA: hypothetical protein DER01_09530 [Phycisphaerales bacterium]|nr:hypothetical protein [Phycisphaerales bacterium]|tara:strand:+ start:787 stop:2064 length:1278 start_codon:yes stop_codon:yes gene_type:complete